MREPTAAARTLPAPPMRPNQAAGWLLDRCQPPLTTDGANCWLIQFEFGLKILSFTAEQRGHSMSSVRPEEISQPPASKGGQTTDDRRDSQNADNHGPSDDAAHHEATVVLVRGEAVHDQEPKSPPKDKEKSPRKEVSESKIKMQSRLPVLDDDPDVGVQKE